MTFWNIGDEECNDADFLANPAAAGLYYLAGSWCMTSIYKRTLPADWFIPDWWVASMPRGKQLAAYLVQVGKWKKVPAGYRYVDIQKSNTPDAIRRMRKADLSKPSRQARRDDP